MSNSSLKGREMLRNAARLSGCAMVAITVVGCGSDPSDLSGEQKYKIYMELKQKETDCITLGKDLAPSGSCSVLPGAFTMCPDGSPMTNEIDGGCEVAEAVPAPAPPPVYQQPPPPQRSQQQREAQGYVLIEMHERMNRAYKGCNSGMMDACDEAERLRKKAQDFSERGVPITKDW